MLGVKREVSEKLTRPPPLYPRRMKAQRHWSLLWEGALIR